MHPNVQDDPQRVDGMHLWRCCASDSSRRLNDKYDFCDEHFNAFFVGAATVRAGDVVWKVVAL